MSFVERARTDPNGLAMDDFERRRSWSELLDRVYRLAHFMRDGLGLQPGDHASMLMGNRVEFYELTLASVLAGTWITPVNWHLTAGEAGYIVEDSHSKVLFTDPELEATARATPGGATVVVAGAELDAVVEAAVDEPFPLDAPPGRAMLYTSGTTGRPKGVRGARQPTVQAAFDVAKAAATTLRLDGQGPHLVTGPLYHSAPLGFSNLAFHAGSPLLLMPRWDPSSNLQLIQEHGVRDLHMVPIMFVRSLRLPDEERAAFDVSSVNTVIHGAAPVSPLVKARMIEWWGPVLLEYWGSTEGGVFTLVDSHDWLTRPGTVGKALPTYEVFAVDDEGHELTKGEVGTLYTRNLVTKDVFEYHDDPEKTSKAHLEPGVFTMGDVGRVDPDGYVYLSDRSADMIISGGVNIYPAEIEQVLLEHPAINDVAVFGIPDEEWGEGVKGAVELAPGHTPSAELEQEILTWARQHLAGFKVPRSLDFEEHLPRHPTGKLYKRLLRDRYWQREGKFI